MKHDLYEVRSRECPTPLTVFALGTAEAITAYQQWSAVNRPSWSPTPSQVGLVPRERLLESPDLIQACHIALAAGMESAVLCHLAYGSRWLPDLPSRKAQGQLAEPRNLVHAYRASVAFNRKPARDVFIFAHDMAHAITLAHEWAEHQGVDPSCVKTVHGMSKDDLDDPLFILRDLSGMGAVGIAGRDPVTDWGIYSPDDECAGRG